MRKFVLLFRRIHLGLLFLFLEGISLTIFFHSDTYMYSKYLCFSENFINYFDAYTFKINSYFSLEQTNESLSKMNASLLAENNYLKSILDTVSIIPATEIPWQSVSSLKVIRNEFLNNNNFLVLDGGKTKGVKKGMAVVCQEGIVGYVSEVSKNFSVAVSLLSTDNFTSSAKIKGTSFSGSLEWNGEKTNIIQMIEVPKYANLNIGDTILTTSYSSVFPENVPIGTVVDFKITDDTFYSVDVKTFTDFSELNFVYLLELKNKEERDSLEFVSGIRK